MDDSYDCVIAGAGPAGLSAAIYLARFNRSVLVVDDGSGRSTTHEVNENYLGFPEGIASKELRQRGRQQAERFEARFARGCIRQARRTDAGFQLTGDVQDILGRTFIIATGVSDRFPDFGNTQEFVGRSLFWCIICDGHKASGKRAGVVGQTDEAAVTCMQFLNFTDKLAFITNAEPGRAALGEKARGRLRSAGIPISEGVIAGVEGEGGMIRAARLSSGERVEMELMFSIQGSEPKNDLAKQLGVALNEQGFIQTDLEQRTNVAGVYAAGDVTRIFSHQVVTAAHEGATAAITANYDLYRPDQKEG